ncbi:glycine--tRNA ligase [Patescibacteria group bacterium]|nr:glycine--tRNA ligase [Patescibacteria group bacterium]
MQTKTFEEIVSLLKRRGFVFPGSEIYGGVANTYDYGPLGAELLRNIRNLWWETFVHKRDDIFAIEASLISHQEVWRASGHTGSFADAMIDCKNCKLRIRADHLIENYLEENDPKRPIISDQISTEEMVRVFRDKKVEGLGLNQLEELIKILKIHCPNCKEYQWTGVRKFNLLFPVNLGIVEKDQSLAYLRGETAQGMFVNFKNVVDSTRVRLPFGVAQEGKSFRNEITPGNSVFRTLEFEQGEIEYFFDPRKSDWQELFQQWKEAMWDFVTNTLGINKNNLRWRTHGDQERSFYSRQTEDLEYNFPFGFKEIWGLSYRTDYDLKQHIKFSKKDLYITDPDTHEKIVPHVIEPAVGINRLFLMVVADAYFKDGERVVLKLKPSIAPYKVAVFPLLANRPGLVEKARYVYDAVKSEFRSAWDDRGNIGKRYLSQDEAGTPFCLTIDFKTLDDGTLTVRNRDTMEQERIRTDNLSRVLTEKL